MLGVDSLLAIAATLAVIGLSALVGIRPMRKIIEMSEARHELKQGSASFLRAMSGWLIIAAWLLMTWFFATITGDWWATGDLEGALARSGDRLAIILEILAAVSDD